MKIKVLLLLCVGLALLIACGPPPQAPEATNTPESTTEEMAEEEMAEEPAADETVSEETTAEEAAVSTPDPNAEIEFTLTEEGDGAQPVAGDFVQVHLVGALEDGTVFADSYQLGDPITFPYGTPGIIPGITQALERMSVGDKAEVVIPPELGFGPQAVGNIPPNSTLYLDIELVDIADIEYEVIEEGSGSETQIGDLVSVHYIGTLEDGTEFDNSYTNEQPLQLILGAGQVIPGWEIGLLKMKEGGKARFIIPASLGYGAQGSPPVIPPDATLIFEVELVAVQQQP